MPRSLVDRLNRDLRSVLASPEVQQRLSTLGGGAAPVSPQQMRDQVATEIERWKRLVETRKIEKQ